MGRTSGLSIILGSYKILGSNKWLIYYSWVSVLQDWAAGCSSPGVTPRKASAAALFTVPNSPSVMSPMQALVPAMAGTRKVRAVFLFRKSEISNLAQMAQSGDMVFIHREICKCVPRIGKKTQENAFSVDL